ncbi:MAG TPA: SDR family NAD(P)-dependent oxidoreductase [Sandaracinaceae bacterium]
MRDGEVAVVVGVGPGLGAAAARRFARGGLSVAMMARDTSKLEPLRSELETEGRTTIAVRCDASEEASVREAFARVREELGDPTVLIYNAGTFRMGGILDVSPEDFERCFRVGAFGAFLAAREVAPAMVAHGRGTMIFTGATASLRGSARFLALASPKFALRGLAQSLARELGPKGVHVAHAIIDGQIDAPHTRAMFPDRGDETFLSPDAIAEAYWQLHVQDRTAWTHEIDLRPAVEKW